ncbi:MAG TPA: hypothetical protein VGM05_24935 [Planctomycetaceae bacterium]|jgi:hypothetical protein
MLLKLRPPRPLWLFLAALSLSIGWGGLYAARIYRHHTALGEMQRYGVKMNVVPGGPDWLRNKVHFKRMDLFDEPVSLDFEGVDLTDDTLRSVGWLTNVERLYLNDTQIGDAGLKHLGGLTNVKRLMLDGTRVSDAGLEYVTGMTKLQQLDLNGTQVTKTGVARLKQALPKCVIVMGD